MPGKTKENDDKVKVLKGQEAEDLVTKYMREVNRPYGAIDITANLKGAVAKAQVQKILAILAEKGSITQKVVGKSSFFVATQTNLEDVPKDQLVAMEEECRTIDEEAKGLQAEIKVVQQELNKIKSSPADEELQVLNDDYANQINALYQRLDPLRSGVPLISSSELDALEQEWIKWRAEWINRRKIGKEVWALFTDDLPPQDSLDLADELGVEGDSPEHDALERGPLCRPKSSNMLKRK